jgi:hypothetical protein
MIKAKGKGKSKDLRVDIPISLFMDVSPELGWPVT